MSAPAIDLRLEVVQVPVSDVDRAKAFYADRAGFVVDHDSSFGDMRVVQLTPPGSACSIVIGTGLAKMDPGHLQGLQLVVTDIEAARAQLADRGVDVSDVQFTGARGSPTARSSCSSSDPDGNGWGVQEWRGTTTGGTA